MTSPFEANDFDPELADLIVDAFEVTVDVDCASRHLWSIHNEVQQVFIEQAAAHEVETGTCSDAERKDQAIEALLAKAKMPEDLRDLNEDAGLSEAIALDSPSSSYAPSLQPQAEAQPLRSAWMSLRSSTGYLVGSGHLAGSDARTFGHRFLATAGAPVLSIMLVLGMSSTGLAMASQNSRPGDLLYSIKRGTEQARLAMASDEVERADLYLAFANERLKELRDVGPVQPEMVASLITEIGNSLEETTDPTAGERIRQAAIIEVKHLEQVAPLPVVLKATDSPTDHKVVTVDQLIEEHLESPIQIVHAVPPVAPIGELTPAPIPVSEAPAAETPPVKPKPKPVESVRTIEAARLVEAAKPVAKPTAKPSPSEPVSPIHIITEPAPPPVEAPEPITEEPARNREEAPAMTPVPADEKVSTKPTAKPSAKPIAKPTASAKQPTQEGASTPIKDLEIETPGAKQGVESSESAE